eukprot:8701640-Pyramimonas_sp.AAC.1
MMLGCTITRRTTVEGPKEQRAVRYFSDSCVRSFLFFASDAVRQPSNPQWRRRTRRGGGGRSRMEEKGGVKKRNDEEK